MRFVLGNAAVAEHDLRVHVDVRVVEKTRRAHDLEPGRLRLDDEQLLLVARDGEDEVEAGVALARHEPLLAVQHPLVAVADGCGLDASDVRARAGLRHGPRLPILAARDRCDEALDLLRSRQLEQLARAAVHHGEAEAVRRPPGLLLDRDLAEHVQVAPAELRRHVQDAEARGSRLAA